MVWLGADDVDAMRITVLLHSLLVVELVKKHDIRAFECLFALSFSQFDGFTLVVEFAPVDQILPRSARPTGKSCALQSPRPRLRLQCLASCRKARTTGTLGHIPFQSTATPPLQATPRHPPFGIIINGGINHYDYEMHATARAERMLLLRVTSALTSAMMKTSSSILE